jgi:methionyl-tRNA formyltransferase
MPDALAQRSTDRSVRVVAVTQDDPFFTGRFFASFLEASRATRVELVEIVLLRNFNESVRGLALRLYRLYGAAGFVRLTGRYLRAKAATAVGRPQTVEGLAKHHGVPTRRLETINDEDYLRTLAERKVDVLLSVASPEIFREAALRSAPSVLNVHNGKLPAYRGMMPTFWALANGDPEIAITVHEMAEKIDAGMIVAEIPLSVEPRESAFDLSQRAKVVAGREVALLLSALGTPEWPVRRPIEVANGAYYTFPTRQDTRRLRAHGRRML